VSAGCPLLRDPAWQTRVTRDLRSSDLAGRVRPGDTLRFRLSTRLAPTEDTPNPPENSVEQVGVRVCTTHAYDSQCHQLEA